MLQFDPEYVRVIAPHMAGKPISEVAREFGPDTTHIVKLASNKNPPGIPQSTKNAMAAAIDEPARYLDANGFNLKAALHAEFGIPETWITLSNGSSDILELTAHTLVSPRQTMVYAQHPFAVYALAAQEVGTYAIRVSARGYSHDLDAMATTIMPGTRLIYIANPNNLTGTLLPADAIAAFLAKVPSMVVIVLDKAYNKFLEPEQQYNSTARMRQYPNLLVSRTFSKAYGLVGLRVGYGTTQPQLTDLLNRIRRPFNVNSLAQATVVAALNDAEFLRQSARLNAASYMQLTDASDWLDLEYAPSSGNFALVHVSDDNGADVHVSVTLLKQGVTIRPVGNYGLPQWLRTSIGLPEENAAFIAALEATLVQEKAAAQLPS